MRYLAYKHSWWTNCNCGASAIDVTACRLCPGQPLSVGSLLLRAFHQRQETAAPLTLSRTPKSSKCSYAAQTDDIEKLLPPRFPRLYPTNINALVITSADHDTQDVDSFLELYDERQPNTGAINRLYAFRSKQPSRPPSCLPCSPLFLLPTSVLDGPSNCLSTGLLVALGFSCPITDDPKLLDPSHAVHSLLQLTDGRPPCMPASLAIPLAHTSVSATPPGRKSQ